MAKKKTEKKELVKMTVSTGVNHYELQVEGHEPKMYFTLDKLLMAMAHYGGEPTEEQTRLFLEAVWSGKSPFADVEKRLSELNHHHQKALKENAELREENMQLSKDILRLDKELAKNFKDEATVELIDFA